jgi:hypothetical protein
MWCQKLVETSRMHEAQRKMEEKGKQRDKAMPK